MIRNPQPGDRVTVPGWPDRRPGVIVEVRRPTRGKGPVRVLVTVDDAEPAADGEPIPRIFGAGDLDAEAVPERNRRRSARR